MRDPSPFPTASAFPEAQTSSPSHGLENQLASVSNSSVLPGQTFQPEKETSSRKLGCMDTSLNRLSLAQSVDKKKMTVTEAIGKGIAPTPNHSN